MPRTFYTERDIEDLAKKGVREIEVNDDVYITDVAREKMEQLGIRAKSAARSTATAAIPTTPSTSPAPSSAGTLTEQEREQVFLKVRSGVIARLGPGVDAAVVDAVVRRVVSQL